MEDREPLYTMCNWRSISAQNGILIDWAV